MKKILSFIILFLFFTLSFCYGWSDHPFTTEEKSKLEALPSDAVEEAPINGTAYERKNGDWVDSTGSIGPTGATGAAGAVGPTGAQGTPGSIGATGPTGPQGDQGETGLAGPTGPTGTAGVLGPTGPTGATGSQGTQGTIGLTGPTGPQGIQGESGEAGLDIIEVTGTQLLTAAQVTNSRIFLNHTETATYTFGTAQTAYELAEPAAVFSFATSEPAYFDCQVGDKIIFVAGEKITMDDGDKMAAVSPEIYDSFVLTPVKIGSDYQWLINCVSGEYEDGGP